MKPSDVSYLALQGGGGKGFAYIGAVEAFEKLGILPQKRGTRTNLEGLSGASVGAIMALLLALGCTSKDLVKIFGSNDRFLKFFDAPATGSARAIRPNDWSATKKFDPRLLTVGARSVRTLGLDLARVVNEITSDADSLFNAIGLASTRMSGATLFALWLSLVPAGRWTSETVRNYPFLAPILKDPTSFLANMFYDRGLFPGFEVRAFLKDVIREFLPLHPNWKKQIPDPAQITFWMLKELVGYDLRVVGTNLSQRRSVCFSAETTPEFHVAEAVGISACFPIIFKPIWIEADAKDPILGDLRGYWVDGGLLNNIPIHAFDKHQSSNEKGLKNKKPTIPLLNERVLGLALRPGAPMSQDYTLPPEGDPFSSFAADLLETTLMPSGPGQYATQQEKDQVIEIFTYNLSLFDFAPTAVAAADPRKSAYDSVLDHFARRL